MEATTPTLETPANREDACIKACNTLLKGELSAIETYEQAIDKYNDEPEIAKLRSIQAEHKNSVRELRDLVLGMAGLPETESGAWGTLTQAVQSAANFFGEESAIRSLTQGERIGKTGYESALHDTNVTSEVKVIIRDRLLPRTEKHIETLESIREQI